MKLSKMYVGAGISVLVAFTVAFGLMSSKPAFALMSSPNINYWDQYAYTEVVYEGDTCGDVDQNAKRGGTYYVCDEGFSCDIFPPDGNKVEEPYGRCVVNERYMCESTRGIVYDDMSCNCPLAFDGGCDGDLIKVTQASTYDTSRNELQIEVTAKNTSDKEISWSEYGSGCGPKEKDIFGVRVKYADPPFALSPTPNPNDVYIVGGEDDFYEFMQGAQLALQNEDAKQTIIDAVYSIDSESTCLAYVKNTFRFDPKESKKAKITIPGYVLDNIAYTIETKYGGTFEFTSAQANAYRASCADGATMVNGRCPKPEMPKKTFTFYDIIGHWAENYILEMLDLAVVEGYKGHYYFPDRPVTRAEFTKMLLLGLNYRVELQPATERPFSDVRVGDWYADYIYTGAINRMIDGYLDGTFRPDEPISRAEAVALLLRMAGIEPYAYSHTFFYDVVSFWQKPYIETAYRLDLINGKGGGKFDPDGNLSRAEAAKIVSNIIRLADTNVPEQTPGINETTETWLK